ncbi:MAG: hypothetical protein HFG26_10300 [Provencibacterium sp.]|nr:hypothetical protein [Provencibacterium sp.]
MTTTTSSSNAGRRLGHLYRFILRRYLGVAVLYFLLQFLFFPLQYILTAADTMQQIAREGPRTEILSFLGNGGIYNAVSRPVMLGMMLFIPVLFPLLQMSYLHQKRPVDLHHALPVRREKLLLVHFAASATMIFAPLLFNYLVVLIAGLGFGFSCFSAAGLFYELLQVSASVLGILSLAYLTSVLAGTVFDNLLYIAGTLFGLPVVLYVAYSCASSQLFGFASVRGFPGSFSLLSPAAYPFYAYSAGSYGVLDSSRVYEETGLDKPLLFFITALVWLLLSAGILILSAWLYRRRPSERAGRVGANNALILPLKIMGALLGGIYFSMLITSSANMERLFLSIPAAVVGGAMTYCLLESVLARGFKTLKKSLGFIAAGALLPALFVWVIGAGALGYESRVPKLEDIESITLTDYQDRYQFTRYDLDGMRALFSDTSPASVKQRRTVYEDDLTLTGEEAVAAIHSLHTAIAESRLEDQVDYPSLRICYRLKNGTALTLSYHSLPEGAVESYNRLGALEEFQRQLHPIFTYGPSDIREITLMNRLMAGVTPVSLSESDTGRLIEALRADLIDEPYEEMVNPEVTGYIVLTPRLGSRYWSSENLQNPDFMLPSTGSYWFNDCYVALTPRYERTAALLGELGYHDFDKVDTSEIETAYLTLDSFYNGTMSLTGPVDFQQAAYRKANEDYLFYRSSYTAGLTDPADIRALTELIRYNQAESLLTLNYTPEEREEYGFWDNSITLSLSLIGKNQDNVITEFYLRPSDVPDAILEKLRDRFSRLWKKEEAFDLLLEKIHEADGSFTRLPVAAETAAAAAEAPSLFRRF